MNCPGSGLRPTLAGRCRACDRFAAPGSTVLQNHTRARIMTDNELTTALHQSPWERDQIAAQEWAVRTALGPKPQEDSDGR